MTPETRAKLERLLYGYGIGRDSKTVNLEDLMDEVGDLLEDAFCCGTMSKTQCTVPLKATPCAFHANAQEVEKAERERCARIANEIGYKYLSEAWVAEEIEELIRKTENK